MSRDRFVFDETAPRPISITKKLAARFLQTASVRTAQVPQLTVPASDRTSRDGRAARPEQRHEEVSIRMIPSHPRKTSCVDAVRAWY
jgi:hypothetical protein